VVQASSGSCAGSGQIGAGDAAAVVADLERQHAVGHGQVDDDPGGAGVLAHISERFLRGPVGHQRNPGRQRGRLALRPQVGAQLAGDAGAALEAAGHPLQRRHQALLQDRRPQVLHDPLAGLDGMRQCLQRRDRALLHRRVAGVAADPVELELQGRQAAADLVVDLAGDGVAFGLDAGLQVLGQLGKPLAGRGQLAVGLGAGASGLGRGDRLLDGRCQTRQVGLQQVIVGAAAHRLDRSVLADPARDQDEGQQRFLLAQQRQRLQAREAR